MLTCCYPYMYNTEVNVLDSIQTAGIKECMFVSAAANRLGKLYIHVNVSRSIVVDTSYAQQEAGI